MGLDFFFFGNALGARFEKQKTDHRLNRKGAFRISWRPASSVHVTPIQNPARSAPLHSTPLPRRALINLPSGGRSGTWSQSPYRQPRAGDRTLRRSSLVGRVLELAFSFRSDGGADDDGERLPRLPVAAGRVTARAEGVHAERLRGVPLHAPLRRPPRGGGGAAGRRGSSGDRDRRGRRRHRRSAASGGVKAPPRRRRHAGPRHARRESPGWAAV